MANMHACVRGLVEPTCTNRRKASRGEGPPSRLRLVRLAVMQLYGAVGASQNRQVKDFNGMKTAVNRTNYKLKRRALGFP